MENLFVPYSIAKQLKENKFNEPCFGVYNEENLIAGVIGIGQPRNHNDLSYVRTWRSSPNDDIVGAPLYQQVIDWFSNEHLIFIAPVCKEWLHTFTCTLNTSHALLETQEYNDEYEAYQHAFRIAFDIIEKERKENEEYEKKSRATNEEVIVRESSLATGYANKLRRLFNK